MDYPYGKYGNSSLSHFGSPFDLIQIGGQGIEMDYHCAKFGDFSFNHFGFTISDRHSHTQNHTQTPLNALLMQLSQYE